MQIWGRVGFTALREPQNHRLRKLEGPVALKSQIGRPGAEFGPHDVLTILNLLPMLGSVGA